MKNKTIKLHKKRHQFHVMREVQEIEKLIKELPSSEISHRLITYGGFSSIGFIKFVADRTVINRLVVSTLRVGKKHLQVMDELYRIGKIKHVDFIIGSVMKNDSEVGKSYGYFDSLDEVCQKNNWTITVMNNHSKIALFDTDQGKFVLETSSNLNACSNIEQFCFLKDTELYDFYEKAWDELIENFKEE